MTRAVIYARFSTELQNEKSTEDQIALCDIAHDLNCEGVRPPRGQRWNASTINGNPQRGHGIDFQRSLCRSYRLE